MNIPPVLVLFRDDLRVADNAALSAAAETQAPILAVFIHDEYSEGMRPLGGAARWWRHHSLAALSRKLGASGIHLVLRAGPTEDVVEDLIAESHAEAVFWNRRYDTGGVAADMSMKRMLRERGIKAESFEGRLLHEPSRLLTKSETVYKVFTPFWKALSSGPDPRDPVRRSETLRAYAGKIASVPLEDLLPLPASPDWAGGLRASWVPGEDGALAQLNDFILHGLDGYAEGRDFPGRESTSRLSPHLAHGEITPFMIFTALRDRASDANSRDVDTFKKEIGWREFCHHLKFHYPQLEERNFQGSFDAFPWATNNNALHAWQRGQTGYPIVDAGMRELWQTGTMHNRVRMIAASFLTKYLLIDWREGERWFWDTLVDADAASNPANWQWVAGSGADAAPYFRIFNPTLQGEKFDADGAYVRRFVPELAKVPNRYIHKPWDAPDQTLADAGIILGKTYPRPIVEHAKSRERALAAYRSMKDDPGGSFPPD